MFESVALVVVVFAVVGILYLSFKRANRIVDRAPNNFKEIDND